MNQQERQLRNPRDSRDSGGQHRTPVGATTYDDETPAETRERHRRAVAEFNEALQEAVDGVEWAAQF